MREFESFDGALLIDKPAGPTSHDIVEHLRHHLGIKKVGHSGTLDPAATGLLILLVGRGTKLSEQLMADDKVYAGWIKLGEATDSQDADGQVTQLKRAWKLVPDKSKRVQDTLVRVMEPSHNMKAYR